MSSLWAGVWAVGLLVLGLVLLDVWRLGPSPNHTLRSLLEQYAIARLAVLLGTFFRLRYNRLARACRHTQEDVLMDILTRNKHTAFHKDHKLDAVETVKEYRRVMPLTSYNDYVTYVERVTEKGELDVMFPGECKFVAYTSGTTSGKSKGFPKDVNRLLRTMSSYCMIAFKTMFQVPGGDLLLKHVFITTKAKAFRSNSGIECGPISLLTYNKSYPSYMTSPKLDISTEHESMYVHLVFALADKYVSLVSTVVSINMLTFMAVLEEHWREICDDIERGTLNGDIAQRIEPPDMAIITKRLQKHPERAEELRAIFRKGFKDVIPKIWPRCRALLASKTGVFATAVTT